MFINRVAIFGGSFDPIHLGHVQIASEIQARLDFDRFIFLPCGQPALKQSCQAAVHDRLAMLKLALADYPKFEISTFELFQPGPSYTIDALIHFRQTFGEHMSISFILGHDAMAKLMNWHHWHRLLDYAHFIYHNRPMLKPKFPRALKHYIQQHQAADPSILLSSSHGYILPLEVQAYPISSSMIRTAIQAQHSVAGMHPKVYEYILKQDLYSKS